MISNRTRASLIWHGSSKRKLLFYLLASSYDIYFLPTLSQNVDNVVYGLIVSADRLVAASDILSNTLISVQVSTTFFSFNLTPHLLSLLGLGRLSLECAKRFREKCSHRQHASLRSHRKIGDFSIQIHTRTQQLE